MHQPPVEVPQSTAPPMPHPQGMPLPQAIASILLFIPTILAPPGPPQPPTLGELETLSAQLIGPQQAAMSRKAQPLIISSALLPIPARMVEKIRNGSFVELKELLSDNVALVQRIQETTAGRKTPVSTHHA